MGIALLQKGASSERHERGVPGAGSRRADLPDPKNYSKLIAQVRDPVREPARPSSSASAARKRRTSERLWAAIAGVGLLFMLLPTVNLVNLNVSRIMERASEIGVRKAFGASSRTLVGQFVVENVTLSLIGAVVGFVLSAARPARDHGERPHPLRAAPPQPPRLPLRGRHRRVLRRLLRGLPGLADVAPEPGAGLEGSLPMIRHYLKLIWNRKRSNLLDHRRDLPVVPRDVRGGHARRPRRGQLPPAARLLLAGRVERAGGHPGREHRRARRDDPARARSRRPGRFLPRSGSSRRSSPSVAPAARPTGNSRVDGRRRTSARGCSSTGSTRSPTACASALEPAPDAEAGGSTRATTARPGCRS